jgi:integrase
MAKRYEGKLKTQVIENKLFGIYRIPIIDEVWARYLTWAKDNKKSWRDDEFRWKHHVEIKLSGKKMDTITAFDVQSVIDQMKSKREYAPATIKHLIVLIRRVFNWAKEMDLYLGDNPALKIKLPKLNNEITESLTKDEISRLLKTLAGWQNQMAALLIQFALFTGLRRGELFKLKRRDVDLDNGWIDLRDTKGGTDNKLPVSEKALDVLHKAKQLAPSQECPYVFPNKRGNRRTTIGNTWTRIKKAASLPQNFRFHGLRHTFASYLASSGKISQYTLQLQKLLTHKTPQMTQRYAHLFDETLRDGANLLPKLI